MVHSLPLLPRTALVHSLPLLPRTAGVHSLPLLPRLLQTIYQSFHPMIPPVSPQRVKSLKAQGYRREDPCPCLNVSQIMRRPYVTCFL